MEVRKNDISCMVKLILDIFHTKKSEKNVED